MQFEAVCAHLGSLGLRVAWTPCFSLLGLVLPGVMGEPLFWQHATSLASGVVFGGVGSSLLPQVNSLAPYPLEHLFITHNSSHFLYSC